MSFTENDRKVQSKNGKTFHPSGGDHTPFAEAIALALQAEFSGFPAAIKTVSRLTGGNERTVRNWFEGKNGPNGESLINLLRESDVVLKTLLGLAGRQELAVVVDLAEVRQQLIETVSAIDRARKANPAAR